MDPTVRDTKRLGRGLAITASLATLGVPVLYIVGFGYDLGYLTEYGINTEFFPRSMQEYLVLAFYSLLYLAVGVHDFAQQQWRGILVVSAVSAFTAMAMVFICRRGLDRRMIAVVATARRRPAADYLIYPTLAWVFTAVVPYLIIVAIFLLLFMPSFGYFEGRKVARDGISNVGQCLKTEPNDDGCVVVKDADNPFKKRRTELIADRRALLSMVSATPIQEFFRSEKTDLIDKLTMVVGTPGCGKTTIAQVVEFESLMTLSTRAAAQINKDLVDVLNQNGLLKDGVPTRRYGLIRGRSRS